MLFDINFSSSKDALLIWSINVIKLSQVLEKLKKAFCNCIRQLKPHILKEERKRGAPIYTALVIDVDNMIIWYFSILIVANWLDFGQSEFLWGAATAAYQVEGAIQEDGRGACIWDTFCALPGRINNGDTGNIAADSYHHLEDDVQLIKNLGLNSFRFSLSWSRILPNGYGPINLSGIAHYSHFIDLLIAAGVQPMVTLYHWDLPQFLESEYAGWLNASRIEEDFVAYADVCFNAFGDRVKLWTTINEPWTASLLGYGTGDFAPGRCSNRSKCAFGDSSTEVYTVGHNMLNAHAAAVQLYRERYQSTQGGKIGIVLNLDFAEPANSDLLADIIAANRMNEFTLGWFGDPIFLGKGYPSSMLHLVGSRLPRFTPAQSKRLHNSVDFLALNSYSMKYAAAADKSSFGVTDSDWQSDQRSTTSMRNSKGKLGGEPAASTWLVVAPEAFRKVLNWVKFRYNNPDVYITENGVDVPGENMSSVPLVLQDEFRINYYQQYLGEVYGAMSAGANIRGYYAWSLIDNFEWKDGYSCRFGLHYVNYSTPMRTRIAKKSAMWYRDWVHESRRTGKPAISYTHDDDTDSRYQRGLFSTWWEYWGHSLMRIPFLPANVDL